MEQENANQSHMWRDDLLDREGDARFLIDFLSRRSEELADSGQAKSFVLNINAEWGQGKTFFLRRLTSQLAEEGYVSVYINAWNDSHAPDPLVAVIAALDHALRPFFKKQNAIKNVWDIAKVNGLQVASAAPTLGIASILRHAGTRPLGEAGSEVLVAGAGGAPRNYRTSCDAPGAEKAEDVDKLSDDDCEGYVLKQFLKVKTSVETFRYSLRRLAVALIDDDKKLPIFIVIDEMDRCRPDYAIGLLERIKRLFDVTHIVFVLATDTKQLSCSVKAVYGSDFESQRYLMHFFDYTYTFAAPDISRFVEFFFETRKIDLNMLESPGLNPVPFTIQMFQHIGLDLRKIEECLDLLRTIVTGWNCPCKVQLLYLLPLIVSYETGNEDVFQALADPCANREIVQKKFITNAWSIIFVGGLFDRSEQIEVHELLDRLCGKLNCNLEEVTRTSDTQTPSQRWMRQQFAEELKLLHHGDYHSHSVMARYHCLVQQAGRLTSG